MAEDIEKDWEEEYETYIHHEPPDSPIIVPQIKRNRLPREDCVFVDFTRASTRGAPLCRAFHAGIPICGSQAVLDDCQLHYRAWRGPNGLSYEDLKTGQIVTELPCTSFKDRKKELKVGMWIELRSCLGNQWYDGSPGVIILFCGQQQALVWIADYSTEVVVSQDEILPISKGRAVKWEDPSSTSGFMHGIMRRTLKDERTHEIVYEVDDSSLWSRGCMQLSPMQICVSRFDGLDAAIRNCASSSFAEHRVVFVKNDMVQEDFFVHFPFKFQMVEAKLQMGQVAKWPLLIYLHGSAGGTFFSFCKREMRVEGARYAAEHFIIVSPTCRWGWKAHRTLGSWSWFRSYAKCPMWIPARST